MSENASQPAEKLSFMDKQFRNMSGCGFWALIVIIPFIALILGLVGLLTCKDQQARKRAGTMTAVGAIWFITCLLLMFAQIGSLSQ